MLKICLSYDYELFMGKNNGSAEEILFNPTEKIKNAMDEFGVKGVFFVDVCSAIAHRKMGLSAYSDAFDAQLKKLVADGHDVQLHIHTSWLKAKLEDNQLLISREGYRIHEFGFDEAKENNVRSIIKESVDYLNSVCKGARDDYKCMAYRAGGFCIQPEHELLKVLCENGILIDSTVVPGYSSLDTVNYSDFRHVPKALNWRIAPETGISKASQYGLFEVPIATSKPRLIECLFTKKKDRSLPGVKPKGEYVKFSSKNKPAKKSKIRKKLDLLFNYRFISLDSRHYKAIIRDLEFIYKKYKLHKSDGYICLICHPKITDDVRIENLKKLISEALKQKEKFEFVTMEDIEKEIRTDKGIEKDA